MSKLKGLKGTEITRSNITIVFKKTDFQNDAQNGLCDWPNSRQPIREEAWSITLELCETVLH